MTPILSIITPVFNGAEYIRGCLENVAIQNCTEIEHIVMDGFSRDKTAEIARKVATKHPYIRVFSEPDTGQSNALNKAIRLAKGPYIGILNADDFYEAGALNRACDIIRTLDTPHFICGNCNVLSEDGSLAYVNRPNLDLAKVLAAPDRWQFPHNPSCYFYARSLHECVGFYDEADHEQMDLTFLLGVLRDAPVRYFDETWGNFRLIPGTKTFEALADGSLIREKRRKFKNAFLHAPMSVKAKTLLAYATHHAQMAHWQLTRRIRGR